MPREGREEGGTLLLKYEPVLNELTAFFFLCSVFDSVVVSHAAQTIGDQISTFLDLQAQEGRLEKLRRC